MIASTTEYALMAGSAYVSTRNSINRIPGASGWSALDPHSGLDHRQNDGSGFEAVAFVKGSEIVISYAGTYAKDLQGDILTDAALGIGQPNLQLFLAASYYADVKRAHPDAKISFTGHSLGGGLASLMSVLFNKPAVTFDQAPFRNAATMSNALLVQAHLLANGYSFDFDLASFISISLPLGSPVVIRGEGNVQGVSTQGEFLSIPPLPALRIGFSRETLNHGAPNESAVDVLHSQALLIALKQSSGFLTASYLLPFMVRDVFDQGLFAADTGPESGKSDFLTHLIRYEFGVPGTPGSTQTLLTHFSNDAMTLGIFGAAPDALKRPLLSMAMQHYYQTLTTPGREFFEKVSGGVRFDLTQMGDQSMLLPNLNVPKYNELLTWIASNVPSEARGDVNDFLKDTARRMTLALGGGIDATTPQDSASDFMLSWTGGGKLAGGGGDDLLVGRSGADDLDGGDGADRLYGGRGIDALTGGAGNDVLNGGTGNDLYIFRSGDGQDKIIEEKEADGKIQGRIQIGGGPAQELLVAGLFTKQGDQNRWLSADGNVTLLYNSPWILTLADGGTIQLGENQDDFQSGDFGILLYEEKARSTTFDLTILGDLKPFDSDPEKDGVQTRTDELGNVIVDPDESEPDRADILYDSVGNDEIKGLGGNDSIIAGRGGIDRIDAGDGNDYFWGGAGSDTVIGGKGTDVLHGADDDDRIFGEAEMTLDAALAKENGAASNLKGDLLDGLDGDDSLMGDLGNDFFAGGAGDDVVAGGAGDDNLYGDTFAWMVGQDWTAARRVDSYGDSTAYWITTNFYNDEVSNVGDDVIYAGGGSDWVRANGGNDYADGGDGDDVLFGDLGNDDLFGGKGDDVINGDNAAFAVTLHGNDYLDGEEGNDSLYGSGGDDLLFGGAGTDKLYGETGDDYLDGEGDADELMGGAGADQLFGGDGNDALQGDYADEAGDDILDGEAGDDLLFGMGGRDELNGGEGADQIAGDLGGDHADGEADTIYGGTGNDLIDAQAGDDFVDAGGDNDIVSGRAGNDQLAGGAGNDQLQGGEGDDTLDGGDDSDVLFGEAGNDILQGGNGVDYLLGGAGDDTLDGGAGDDVYYYAIGEGNDHIVDAGGTDWLVFEDLNWGSITLGVGSLKLTVPGGEIHLDDFDPDNPLAAGGIEYFAFADGTAMSKAQLVNALGFKPIGTPEADDLSGTALNDTITALAGNDVVTARAGNDTIYLDGGDDAADAGAGNDSVYGGDGADQIAGGEGNDTVYGGLGDDFVLGDAGDDVLYGDAGNDVLSGGAGSDALDGGEEDDTFVFARGDGADVVNDGAGSNQVQLGSGLVADDVVFSHQGNDLVVAIKNTSDQLTVRNWFAADSHFAGVTLGNGTTLDHAGVEALMPLNQAPLLTADAGTVVEDSLLAVSGNVLSNDADPEGRVLRVTNAGTYAGSVGSLTLASTGNYSYTLSNGAAAVQSLAAGEVLSESFAYAATDDDPNGAASAQSAIVISVKGANDLPSLGSDTAATSEDAVTPLTGNVLTNDRDVDNGTLLTVSNPGPRVGSYGSLTLAADGAYSYQLNTTSTAVQSLAAGQVVTDLFAPSISDGVAAVAGSLAITVNGQNDAPILSTPLLDQNASPNTAWTWQMPAGSFTDVDAGDVLTYGASLSDGSVLPSWLSFSAETQTFSGRVPKSASGAIEISISVADRLGAKATDSFTLMFDMSSGGGGGGTGGSGGGSQANEGVGNGIDAPPPGQELSFNDGAGAGPGDPGAMGGNGYRPKSRRELTMTDVHISGPIKAPPVVSMTHGHSANAPGKMPSSRDALSNVGLAADTSNDGALLPGVETVADAETPLPVANAVGATGTGDPLAAWLDALSPQLADEVHSANISANGPADAWGLVDATLLTHLATAYDDGAVLNPRGRPSLGQPFLATAEDPLALLAANTSLQQFTGLKEGLSKLA